MRIRGDSVFISSALFSLALASLVPAFCANLVSEQQTWLVKFGYGASTNTQTIGDLSIASLAVILVALIVVWTGYIERVRWTWFVMFIIVWGWAFPLLVLPLLRGRFPLRLNEWLGDAIYTSGSARSWALLVLIFSLMVVALLLPIRSFFLASDRTKPTPTPSLRRVAVLIAVALVLLVALFTWVRVGVLREIPPTPLNSTREVPFPPPPCGRDEGSPVNSGQRLVNKGVSQKPPFSITVVPQDSGDHGQWISMRQAGFIKPFYVVLTNTTSEPQSVFEAWNGWGYKAITFELLTEDCQRVVVSRKDKDFDKNYPSTFIVPPGENYVYTIALTNEDWTAVPSLRFSNVEAVAVHLKAIYQLTPTRASRKVGKRIWIGRVESNDYTFQLVHE